ncbi:HRDC domain-containing protein, partial [Selenomonas sp. KH1T6]|uniref:HRDC domain-containing protein n=1 Tax=Selenomonas sp. KH1T6 TaxID=3158784 RepID=UPI0008A723D7
TESKFPVLTLKPAAYPVLKGQEKVFQAVPKPEPEKTPADSGLFDKLRRLRKEIATREHVPPYVVFSDATLKDMCAVQPKTLDEMLEVKGIGEMKLERYGEEFLKCLLEG